MGCFWLSCICVCESVCAVCILIHIYIYIYTYNVHTYIHSETIVHFYMSCSVCPFLLFFRWRILVGWKEFLVLSVCSGVLRALGDLGPTGSREGDFNRCSSCQITKNHMLNPGLFSDGLALLKVRWSGFLQGFRVTLRVLYCTYHHRPGKFLRPQLLLESEFRIWVERVSCTCHTYANMIRGPSAYYAIRTTRTSKSSIRSTNPKP